MTRRARHHGFTVVELLIVVAVVALLASILLPSVRRARGMAQRAACASNLRQLVTANLGYAAENGGHYVLAAEDILFRSNRKRWHGERQGLNEPFDPKYGPLEPYLGGGAVKQCPSFEPAAGGFEAGCGGYGYNHYYLGGRYDGRYKTSAGRGDEPKACQYSATVGQVTQPSRTVMFTDAAIGRDGPLRVEEYSFCEPPYSPGTTDRRAASIHFRHLRLCNVAWVDGRVDAQPMTFSAGYGVYDICESEARGLGFGWFGPDSNELFDLK